MDHAPAHPIHQLIQTATTTLVSLVVLDLWLTILVVPSAVTTLEYHSKF